MRSRGRSSNGASRSSLIDGFVHFGTLVAIEGRGDRRVGRVPRPCGSVPLGPDDAYMSSEVPPTKEASRREAGYVIAFVLSCIAVFWAVFATGLSARAVDKAGKTSVNAAAPAASAPVTVTLSEFKVSPATIQATTGSTITVTNTGSVAHNLTVKDKKLATPDLAPKQSAPLDISTLPAGEYTVICAVPGHETAGMTAKLVVKEGAATGQDM